MKEIYVVFEHDPADQWNERGTLAGVYSSREKAEKGVKRFEVLYPESVFEVIGYTLDYWL